MSRVQRLTRAIALCSIFLIAAVTLIDAASAQSSAQKPTVLITGSNRGIGFEFARQFAMKGWRVLATARRPEAAADLKKLAKQYPSVSIDRLDVTEQETIDALAQKLRNQPIDLLINNAGVLGDPRAQTLQRMDYEKFKQVMAVNVYGALSVSRAFVDQVASSRQKKIVSISSVMGSIASTRGRWGGFYFYRISKAGLNMAMRTLQADLRDRGIIVAMLHPGAVDTRMLRQAGYRGTGMSPRESVAGLIKVIESLSPENRGSFIRYNGQKVPW